MASHSEGESPLKAVVVLIGIAALFLACVVWIVRGGPVKLVEHFERSKFDSPLPKLVGWLGSSSSTLALPGAIEQQYIPLQGIEGEWPLQGSSETNPVNPKKLSIVDDSQGATNDFPDSEYIELVAGEKSISIQGIRLRSKVTGSYIYLRNAITLQPEERIDVFTGGDPRQNAHAGSSWVVYMGYQTDAWGDEHDSIDLLAADGTRLDTLTY